MLAILFITNRYLFGISVIMAGITLKLLFANVLNLTTDVSIILQSLVVFGIIFVFIHAILGNAGKKLKLLLETIAISIVFLSIIFEASWLVGIYIGTLCIIFALKGFNSNFSAYFYTGIVFLILNILVQFKNYWANIPSWAYILVGGLVLVGVVTYKEYRNVKPKIKEVNEQKNEVSEENQSKIVSDEVLILAIAMLVVSLGNVKILFDKINYSNKIANNISYIERF